MRLLSIEQIKPDNVLGKSIYNERNQVLLNKGVEIVELYEVNLMNRLDVMIIGCNDTSRTSTV